MSFEEKQDFCESCNKKVLARRESPTHFFRCSQCGKVAGKVMFLEDWKELQLKKRKKRKLGLHELMS